MCSPPECSLHWAGSRSWGPQLEGRGAAFPGRCIPVHWCRPVIMTSAVSAILVTLKITHTHLSPPLPSTHHFVPFPWNSHCLYIPLKGWVLNQALSYRWKYVTWSLWALGGLSLFQMSSEFPASQKGLWAFEWFRADDSINSVTINIYYSVFMFTVFCIIFVEKILLF